MKIEDDKNVVYFFCRHVFCCACMDVEVKFSDVGKVDLKSDYDQVEAVYSSLETIGRGRRRSVWIDNKGLVCPICEIQ
jgi:hypothetical protein